MNPGPGGTVPEWDSIASSRAHVPRHVVHRMFPSETVLLNVETGHYYGMDPIGARFFDIIRNSPDLRAALASLVEEYEGSEDQIRADLIRFCDELLSLGLIELEAVPKEVNR